MSRSTTIRAAEFKAQGLPLMDPVAASEYIGNVVSPLIEPPLPTETSQ